MCSEISAVYVSNDEHNDDCLKFTNKIKSAFYNIAREFVYIGFLLAECDYYETYKEWGYSSIHEYASDRLGLKKSSTYNFINVCKAFTEPTDCVPCSYFMKDKYENFNYSQLVEMLSMSDKQRSLVTPDMSVKQIREVKKSFHEPEYTKLYYMQLNFQEFREVYHRKINGKKFLLTVSGRKCESSDIRPDGYYVSFHSEILNDCGHSCGYNRIVDYKEFVDLVLRFWNAYSQSDDSRRLESEPEEATSSAPDEAPPVNANFDLLEPHPSDICDLFNEIEEASLSVTGIDVPLSEIAMRIFQEHNYVIYKKIK